MAHALSLTDGTTTISLSTSGCFLTHYVPEGPESNGAGEYKPVTEAIEFVIADTTVAAVQTKLQAIERLLYRAQLRSVTGTGPRAYLLFQVHGEAAAARGQILAYKIVLDADAAPALVQLKLGVRLIITRLAYWEGARTAIALSNSNGTDLTSGLTVRNHDDAGAGDDNWANIAAAAIGGALPAPLELKLVNASGGNRDYVNFHIANNIYGQALAHIIEGENTVSSGYGAAGSSAACSNGQYATLTGAGWLNFRWSIPSATLNLLAGRYMRILVRFHVLNAADREVKVALYESNGIAVIARSPAAVARNGAIMIQDCGALPLPASQPGGSWAPHVLEVSVKTPSSEQVAIDFVQLTPTEPTLYRKVIQRGFYLPNGDALVDDGIEGLSYYEYAATGLRDLIYVARTDPVHVWPGVDQRLLFLHDGLSQAITWTLTVQAWYRPRRTLL